jgi:MoaA/NifB/PqqE/SkfB family radical SAM enzyme
MINNLKKKIDTTARAERLSIEVTTHCNSACLHCFVRSEESKRSSLPIDIFKEIVAEGYNTNYRHLHITGGEPLVWEHLFEGLNYVFEIGYQTVFLNTNGLMFTNDICSKLGAYEGLSISVSLEGPEELHDRFRGAGSYRQAIQGIEKALDAGINLFIFTTVCKSLIPNLPDFADKLYKQFKAINYLILIQLINVKNEISDLSKELINPDDFIHLVRTVSLLNLYGLKSHVLNDPLAGLVSKMLQMPWIQPARPLYADGNIFVMANRKMSLSHSSREFHCKYEPGMIEKVLASDAYRSSVAPDTKICPSCNYTERCIESGMVRPSEKYVDMHPEVPFCKRVLDRIST